MLVKEHGYLTQLLTLHIRASGVRYYNKIALLILIFFSVNTFCQNLNNDYVQINSIKLDSSIQYNSSLIHDLTKYNGYFIGEKHNAKNLTSVKCLLISKIILIKKIEFIFLEFPVSSYYDYQDIYNNRNIVDINEDIWERLSGYTPKNKELLKYVYESRKESQYDLIPIDCDNDLRSLSKDILDCFNYDIDSKNDIISQGFDYLYCSSKLFSSMQKRIEGFSKFNKYFNLNYALYEKTLKEKCKVVKKKLESGIVLIDALKEKKSLYFKSQFRENYMYNNIQETLNDSSNFISFNGQFHIPLNIPEVWVGVTKWESLAYKIKVTHPQKICSIYLMNRNSDVLSDVNFPLEKKILLENTKAGDVYLIRLDGENTPFKELSEKFQYIVVW